jgi:hypothetical protein
MLGDELLEFVLEDVYLLHCYSKDLMKKIELMVVLTNIGIFSQVM